MSVARALCLQLAAAVLLGACGHAHAHVASPTPVDVASPARAVASATIAITPSPPATAIETAPAAPSPALPATPAAIPTPAVPMPDRALTPGDVLAGATRAQVCTSGYARSVRSVSAAEKREVYEEYGVASSAYGAYEVDHLVPLELGGSNDIRNLWPQPALPVPGFHEKDDLENRLHDLVCGGDIGLAEAQRALASDWLAAYWRYVGGIER